MGPREELPAVLRVVSFYAKGEGGEEVRKKLKCGWCKNWCKGLATRKSKRKAEAEEATKYQDGKLLPEALSLFEALLSLLILWDKQ